MTPVVPLSPLSPLYLSTFGLYPSNTCIESAGTDGTWYFYDASVPFGVATPSSASDGTLFYALKCNASGDWECRCGATGTTQLTDITELLVTSDGYTDVMTWDDTKSAYVAINLPKSSYVISEIDGAGLPKTCFTIEAFPLGEIIVYDFVLERI
jgi:hypothetical protein